MDNLVDNHDDYQELSVREYAQLFDLPEQTVRSRLRVKRLEGVDVIRDGQTVRGVRFKLSDAHADNQSLGTNNQGNNLRLALDNPVITPQLSQITTPDYQMIIENYEARIKDLKEVINKLEADNGEKTQRVDDLTQKLADERARASLFEGELKAKDETIASKDETIRAKEQAVNAANGLVMIMEQQRPSMDAPAPKQIGTPSSWWDKLEFWKR